MTLLDKNLCITYFIVIFLCHFHSHSRIDAVLNVPALLKYEAQTILTAVKVKGSLFNDVHISRLNNDSL
jgi:hypothetical protein